MWGGGCLYTIYAVTLAQGLEGILEKNRRTEQKLCWAGLRVWIGKHTSGVDNEPLSITVKVLIEGWETCEGKAAG